MAKITAPFFSLTASGKLGESIVYANWKGIKYVRQYVVPANPQTSAQQAQRGRMTNAVADWHNIGLLQADVDAYKKWAQVAPSPMSGFNLFCSKNIGVQQSGDAWSDPYNIGMTDVLATTATVYVYQKDNTATLDGDVYLGANQGYMPKDGALSWDAGNTRYKRDITGLLANTKYFLRVQLYDVANDIDGWLGDITFTTAAS